MSISRPVIACSALLAVALACAPLTAKDKEERPAHRFAVVGNDAAAEGDARLKQALADSSEKSVSFVVLTGIKGENESCGDKLYQQRRDLFEHAKRPVIVSLAGSDWTGCRNSAKRTNAIERLNRLRELLYGEPESLGATRIHLTQLSASPRFRSYAENAHWKVDKVLYATINLPAANNHFLPAAGRNSEYEDRAVANRFWLNRLFAMARSDKAQALVLFSEGGRAPVPSRSAGGPARPVAARAGRTRRVRSRAASDPGAGCQIRWQGAAGRQQRAGWPHAAHYVEG